MVFKKVFRADRFSTGKFFKFNLFRIIFAGKTKCFKFALQPKIFHSQKEPYRGWNVTLLGLRITYEYSFGGYLA